MKKVISILLLLLFFIPAALICLAIWAGIGLLEWAERGEQP